jgi:hypothetical protein
VRHHSLRFTNKPPAAANQVPNTLSLPHRPPGSGLVCTFLHHRTPSSLPAPLPTCYQPSPFAEWVSLSPSTTMNGMSRFLSRRDKHHEKRASKHANTKVRLSSFASVNSLSPLLCSVAAAVPDDSAHCPRRLSASIETLYHKIPFVLRTSVEDSLLFLHQKLPCRAASLPYNFNQTSPSHSSDYVLLQSKSSNASVDLYKIFTSEGPRPPANNEHEKKVREGARLHGIFLTGCRSGCCFCAFKGLA